MIISNIARLAAPRLWGLFRISSVMNLPVKSSPSPWPHSSACAWAYDCDAPTSLAALRLSPELMFIC
jgi:hypothetical protein